MLKATARDVNASRLEQRLEEALQQSRKGLLSSQVVKDVGLRVLATAKRIGKARFAQIAARHADKAKSLPKYIEDALTWILEP
jgi:putative ATP-dependent endonuclease of OLD family